MNSIPKLNREKTFADRILSNTKTELIQEQELMTKYFNNEKYISRIDSYLKKIKEDKDELKNV